MEKHYVVMHCWADEDTSASDILGVAHSLDEAKDIFNEHLKAEREHADNHGYTIYDDLDVLFDAGCDGHYMDHHTCLYIQEV